MSEWATVAWPDWPVPGPRPRPHLAWQTASQLDCLPRPEPPGLSPCRVCSPLAAVVPVQARTLKTASPPPSAMKQPTNLATSQPPIIHASLSPTQNLQHHTKLQPPPSGSPTLLQLTPTSSHVPFCPRYLPIFVWHHSGCLRATPASGRGCQPASRTPLLVPVLWHGPGLS